MYSGKPATCILQAWCYNNDLNVTHRHAPGLQYTATSVLADRTVALAYYDRLVSVCRRRL